MTYFGLSKPLLVLDVDGTFSRIFLEGEGAEVRDRYVVRSAREPSTSADSNVSGMRGRTAWSLSDRQVSHVAQHLIT